MWWPSHHIRRYGRLSDSPLGHNQGAGTEHGRMTPNRASIPPSLWLFRTWCAGAGDTASCHSDEMLRPVGGITVVIS